MHNQFSSAETAIGPGRVINAGNGLHKNETSIGIISAKRGFLTILSLVILVFFVGCVSPPPKRQHKIYSLPGPTIGVGDEYAEPFLGRVK